MKTIGIGITTMNRPDCLKKCLDSIKKHTFNDGVSIYVADDSVNRVGVAKRKNECLRALKHCDHVFLLDDDVSIIRDGWIEFFIQSNVGHCMFLSHKLHNFKYQKDNVKVFADCGGVFLYMDKKAIEKVGAFDEKFEFWGMEHCDWSMRWNDRNREFYMLEGTENYLYAEDYSNPNHKSSITNEEKNLLFRKNFTKFAKGIDKIYLPL